LPPAFLVLLLSKGGSCIKELTVTTLLLGL
jgi:hypothetical protein